MAARGPRARRVPNRRSAPIRPGNHAAGAADAAKENDADGTATAHPRSSNRARSHGRPSNRDAPPAFLPPGSGRSRHTLARNRQSQSANLCRQPMIAWLAAMLGNQARGTLLFEAVQQTKHLTPLQADQRASVSYPQTAALHPQQYLKTAELLLAHRHHRHGAPSGTPEPAGMSGVTGRFVKNCTLSQAAPGEASPYFDLSADRLLFQEPAQFPGKALMPLATCRSQMNAELVRRLWQEAEALQPSVH